MSLPDRITSRAWLGLLPLLVIAGCSRSDPKPTPTVPSNASGTAQTSQGAGAQARSQGLPARHAIAGIPGFQTSSRIVYASKPDKVHELSATYLFPERVRLRVSLAQDKLVDRVLLYRRGEHGFFVDQRQSDSRELAGEELAALILQTELRRALFLWPDGFDWRGEGRERSVELVPEGRFVAQLGDDRRPTTISSFDVAGHAIETLAEIRWKPWKTRQFPAHFTLNSGGERIWDEDVLDVETALNYVDAFFLPPDRRAPRTQAESDSPGSPIEAIDLPELWEIRVPLGSGSSVSEARAAAGSARSAWRARGIAALEETVLEIDRQGLPTACIVRAASAGTPPASGWILRPECPAWSQTLREATAGAKSIDAMAARLALDDEGPCFQLHLAASEKGAESARLVVAQRIR